MKKLYLDNASTTYVAEEVKKEVIEKINLFANPSSRHSLGISAKLEIESAREKIAEYIGAKSDEIIFTSGATESNNLAIKGLAIANPLKKHIIISSIEHPSIIEVCKSLKKQNYEVDIVEVSLEGIVDIESIKDKIREDTLVVSVMHVNNEIGTIQPIEEIAKICKEKKVLFHVDAVQSFAKIPINISATGIDLLSASGHKINALKGVGFLYIKNGTKISPLTDGGGQENNLRSGTENLVGILSIAKAIDLKRPIEEIENSRNRILSELLKIPGSRLNGSFKNRIYNNISISFYGIEGESLMMLLDEEGIFVSTGSACSSNNLSGSHVLKAINLDKYYFNGSIRISLDSLRTLSKNEEEYLVEKIKNSVERLTKISPFKWKGDNGNDS